METLARQIPIEDARWIGGQLDTYRRIRSVTVFGFTVFAYRSGHIPEWWCSALWP
jgi:hypothetical protein